MSGLVVAIGNNNNIKVTYKWDEEHLYPKDFIIFDERMMKMK